jgi:dTMP kinase
MFITLEGPEGSGKTSQLALLVDFLRQQGYTVLATREPGGTQIGDQIRAVLSDMGNQEMRPRTELLLFQASRSQLVEQVIRPHLQEGGIVLCDRYADSTLAYQGYGHQTFPLEQVQAIISFATGGLKPDLTLLLDVDVKDGLQRRAQGGDWNRLDAYQLEFHQRVRQGYLQMAQAEPQRWVMIDASRSMEAVQAEIREVVLAALEKRGT